MCRPSPGADRPDRSGLRPETVRDLTEIADEEVACHLPDRVNRCVVCGRVWPCGLRRWAEEWLATRRVT
ncbi:hypothetical protein [Longispora urticae]